MERIAKFLHVFCAALFIVLITLALVDGEYIEALAWGNALIWCANAAIPREERITLIIAKEDE